MSWLIRLKLNALPVLDSNGIDAVILSRDIYARLGLPRDWSNKLKTKKAVKMFYSAEGYSCTHKPGNSCSSNSTHISSADSGLATPKNEEKQ